MNTIKDIVERNGGMEWLPRHSPLLISIDPFNHFTIEHAGLSPNNLPAVAVSFFDRDRGENFHQQIVFEVTDLGWLGYYLLSKKELIALEVYELDESEHVEKIDRVARSQIINFTQNLDEELEVLLSPDQVVLT
jgi:hypothetical protein